MLYNWTACRLRRGVCLFLKPLLFKTVLLLIVVSCSQGQKDSSFNDTEIEINEDYEELSELREIFYDLYSPTEAHKLIQHLDITFDPDILNPTENQYQYISSGKNAVNLGVYGADLSYCHLFGQAQEAINYMTAIYRLADRLGVGGDIVSQTERAMERSVYDPDSLFAKAGDIYYQADNRLKENEREGAAALILAGGWVEALYIAASFYDENNPDPNLEKQILSQKYSLERLVALLSNFQNDEFTARYLFMLRQLKIVFDTVEILYEQDDLVIDREHRKITSASPEFVYSPGTITQITSKINSIRTDMVN